MARVTSGGRRLALDEGVSSRSGTMGHYRRKAERMRLCLGGLLCGRSFRVRRTDRRLLTGIHARKRLPMPPAAAVAHPAGLRGIEACVRRCGGAGWHGIERVNYAVSCELGEHCWIERSREDVCPVVVVAAAVGKHGRLVAAAEEIRGGRALARGKREGVRLIGAGEAEGLNPGRVLGRGREGGGGDRALV